MGHEVRIIASPETYDNTHQKLVYLQPKSYYTNDDIFIKRIQYSNLIPLKIARKIRYYPGLMDEIENFKPEFIFAHGIQMYDILTLSKFKDKYPDTKIVMDNHADDHNSAQNIISKNILHKFIYKKWIKKSLKNIDKIYYTTPETKEFAIKMYDIPDEKMEYLPLGGIYMKIANTMSIDVKLENIIK